jgi:hypothetical protein
VIAVHQSKLNYAGPDEQTTVAAWVYAVFRVVTAVGGFVALVMVGSEIMFPVPDSGGSPPSPSTRSVWIATAAAISTLLIVPYRLTYLPALYWPRLILHVLIGLYLTRLGIWGLSEGVWGDKHPLIIPFALATVLVGIATPLSLVLKRRLVLRAM